MRWHGGRKWARAAADSSLRCPARVPGGSQVLELVGSRTSGLTKAEADAALQRYGKNATPDKPKPSIFKRIFDLINNSVGAPAHERG